MLFKIKQ